MKNIPTLESLESLLRDYEDIAEYYHIESKIGLYMDFKKEIRYIKSVIKQHYPDWQDWKELAKRNI